MSPKTLVQRVHDAWAGDVSGTTGDVLHQPTRAGLTVKTFKSFRGARCRPLPHNNQGFSLSFLTLTKAGGSSERST